MLASRLTAPLLVALSIAGCASVTQGTSQTVSFVLSPTHATCSVVRDGEGELGALTRSQRSLTVSKDKDDLVLTCQAAGHATKVQRVRSTTQTEGVMSFMFLDLGITDMITGAMWAYPAVVSVALEPLEGQAAPSLTAAQSVAAPAAPGGAAAPSRVIGQESYQVERMPEVKACSGAPRADLIGKGPGFETYAVACANGDLLTVRCEMGACRVLR